MKLSTELKELPIVSIAEGEEVGTVKDFIVDPVAKAVVALVIEDSTMYYEGVKIISFSLIHSIGDFAITTENSSSVVSLNNMPELIDLIKKELTIIDAKVITRSGRLVGYVKEYSLDSRTGELVGLELTSDSELNAQGQSIIPADSIVTLGKDVIIVVDDVETQLGASHAELVGATPSTPRPAPVAAPAPKPIVEIDELSAIDEPSAAPEPIDDEDEPEVDIEELLDLDTDAEVSGLVDEPGVAEEDGGIEVEAADDEESKESLSEIFERRQIKYMIGKQVSREIQSDDGITVAEQGETITDEIIEKAKEAGKFLELSMNIEIEE